MFVCWSQEKNRHKKYIESHRSLLHDAIFVCGFSIVLMSLNPEYSETRFGYLLQGLGDNPFYKRIPNNIIFNPKLLSLPFGTIFGNNWTTISTSGHTVFWPFISFFPTTFVYFFDNFNEWNMRGLDRGFFSKLDLRILTKSFCTKSKSLGHH